MQPKRKKKLTKKGAALVSAMIVLSLLAVASTSYVNRATGTVRVATRQSKDIITSHLCEAGTQAVLRELWRPFKVEQKFNSMDEECTGASTGSPRSSLSGTIPGVGRYSAGIVSFETPEGDTYKRVVTVRSVGWIDTNNNGNVDENEARKVVDVSAQYELARSQVFDYTYFVNNYGWMDGFGPRDLIVNGDMRANANFDFLNGSPTVNGSVYATVNDKLVPKSVGLINAAPVKMSNGDYREKYGENPRVRQVYSSSRFGAKGTNEYEKWRDFLFDSSGSMVNGRPSGSNLNDSTGVKSWNRTGTEDAGTKVTLDTSPTHEIIMPDLSDLNTYIGMSESYTNTRQTYADGTPDPNYGQEAFVEVWTTSGGGHYQRISSDGVVTGSVMLIGSDDHPIKINGPVTITQDVVIKGTIQGQGTLYAGRNVHIVGSVKYKNGPDFRGSNPTSVDTANEKKDFLGLAARQSVIFGNPAEFGDPYPLRYMTPPFTKGRYDENGNWIPPYNANDVDSTGRRKYQSTFSDSAINDIASSVNQIDAIIYTNFAGGGNLGRGGGGVTFNGTLISRDEAMVVWSLPIVQNYDNRIRERALTRKPLIDLDLPRSPVMLRSTWQDRGFSTGGSDNYVQQENQ
ncbi:MAG: hypothetical protein JST40_08445 [Armatimonadetes bacterium]|nr:hypothetical protein [Armatimonadota bacterium]